MALDLLAMEQPMAVDLRFILSVIRINADLERVGDQAVNIAVRVREMGMFANIDLPVDIPKLASLSSAMVRKALQAFIEADADLASRCSARRPGRRDERRRVLLAEHAHQGEA
jgi:phosphate transport system protein